MYHIYEVVKCYLIRAYPWSKKHMVNDWENIIASWEESEQCQQVWLTPKTAGELQVLAAVQRHEKFAIFTIT